MPLDDVELGARIIQKLRKIVEDCRDCHGKGWVKEGARQGHYALSCTAPWGAYVCGGPCWRARALLEMPPVSDPEFLRMAEERRKWDINQWR